MLATHPPDDVVLRCDTLVPPVRPLSADGAICSLVATLGDPRGASLCRAVPGWLPGTCQEDLLTNHAALQRVWDRARSVTLGLIRPTVRVAGTHLFHNAFMLPEGSPANRPPFNIETFY